MPPRRIASRNCPATFHPTGSMRTMERLHPGGVPAGSPEVLVSLPGCDSRGGGDVWDPSGIRRCFDNFIWVMPEMCLRIGATPWVMASPCDCGLKARLWTAAGHRRFERLTGSNIGAGWSRQIRVPAGGRWDRRWRGWMFPPKAVKRASPQSKGGRSALFPLCVPFVARHCVRAW